MSGQYHMVGVDWAGIRVDETALGGAILDPDARPASWISAERVPNIRRIDLTGPGERSAVIVRGTVAGLDTTFDTVWADLSFATVGAGAPCDAEPEGRLATRDPDGNWFELVFEGTSCDGMWRLASRRGRRGRGVPEPGRAMALNNPRILAMGLCLALVGCSKTPGTKQGPGDTDTTAATGASTPRTPQPDYTPLPPLQRLVRASLDLRGVRPSPEELAAVLADPSMVEASISKFVRDDPRFISRLRWLAADLFWTYDSHVFIGPMILRAGTRATHPLPGGWRRAPPRLRPHRERRPSALGARHRRLDHGQRHAHRHVATGATRSTSGGLVFDPLHRRQTHPQACSP